MVTFKDKKKTTILDLAEKKRRGQKISMVTAYDYPTAIFVEKAGIDVILVGDSLGMVVLGYENTIPVKLHDIIYHSKAVVRGAKKPLIIGDMPFLSFNIKVDEAIRNAGKLMKEGGVDAVKIEGGKEMSETVAGLVKAGIPVMGHIGLTPQRLSLLGGYCVQGKDIKSAKRLMGDAREIEESGAFSLVLECITAEVAKEITRKMTIPTIGIGSGIYCDGQALVFHDLVGMSERFKPRHAKKYVNLDEIIVKALNNYREEVESSLFPSEEHSFFMEESERSELTSNTKHGNINRIP